MDNLVQKMEFDWWDASTSQQQETIIKSMQDLENGKGIPHSVIKQKVNKLLGRTQKNI